jgi:hypothetical protein
MSQKLKASNQEARYTNEKMTHFRSKQRQSNTAETHNRHAHSPKPISRNANSQHHKSISAILTSTARPSGSEFLKVLEGCKTAAISRTTQSIHGHHASCDNIAKQQQIRNAS